MQFAVAVEFDRVTATPTAVALSLLLGYTLFFSSLGLLLR